jgi:hypothetical protein
MMEEAIPGPKIQKHNKCTPKIRETSRDLKIQHVDEEEYETIDFEFDGTVYTVPTIDISQVEW